MKLKSLAALIFRILGAFLMLGCIQALLAGMGTHNIIPALIEAVISLVIGYCLIIYSKKLAALFCKGLDDNDVA